MEFIRLFLNHEGHEEKNHAFLRPLNTVLMYYLEPFSKRRSGTNCHAVVFLKGDML